MSGSNTGRPAHTDPEWARNMEQRVRALEQSSTKRIGDWTILQREQRLLAMNNQDGSTVALDGEVIVEQVGGSTATRGFVVRQELIDSLTGQDTTLTGPSGLAAIIADLRALLGHPAGLGTGFPSAGRGGGDIVEYIGDLIDQLVAGALGVTPSGNTAADVANALANHRLSILSNKAVAEAVALAVADAAFTNPAFHAVDPTLNAVFNLTTIAGTTPTTIAVKEVGSVIGYIRIPTATRKATVAWQGYGTTNIDRIMLNIYKVNTATDANTPVFSIDASQFVSNTLIGGQIPWVYVPITAFDVAQGDCYGAEISVEGSGTHTLVGLPDHWLAPNPNVFPAQLAATRVAGPPIFEALGTGMRSAINTTNPGGSWLHTAAEDSTVLAVVTTYMPTASYTAFTRSLTFAGIGMQSLGAVNHNNASNGWTEYFLLERAPNLAGAATIVLSITGSGTFRGVTAQSISYRQVGSVGPLQTDFGGGTALASGAFVSDATNVIVQSFAGVSAIGAAYALSGYTGASRYTDTTVNGANSLAFLLGEHAGAASVSFGATGNKTTPWSSAGVALAGVVPPAQPVTTPTYSRHVPWIALSSQTDATRGTYAPERTAFLIHNIDDYTPPIWCTHVDFIAVGAGGSGEGEVGFNMGQGGEAGTWSGTTLIAGDDFIPGETVFTVTPGGGGHAIIGFFANGIDGDPTVITWTDVSGTFRTITVPGGDGGHLGPLFNYSGRSPGNFTYQGETYYGGKACPPGAAGNEPGGGGGGAVIFQPFSGRGADGAVWAVARQVGTFVPSTGAGPVFTFTFPTTLG